MEPSKICRRKFITCRVSKEEKEIIDSNALKSGKDISTFVRDRLLLTDKEFLKELLQKA
jgi:uncharacterized protein (DUF1778 family)